MHGYTFDADLKMIPGKHRDHIPVTAGVPQGWDGQARTS